METQDFQSRCRTIAEKAHYISIELFNLHMKYKDNDASSYILLSAFNAMACREILIKESFTHKALEPIPTNLTSLYVSTAQLYEDLIEYDKHHHDDFAKTVHQLGIVSAAENAADFAKQMYFIFLKAKKRQGSLEPHLLELLDTPSNSD